MWTVLNGQVVRVYDQGTGQPVDLVILSSPDGSSFTTTNIHGEADISSFTGLDTIMVQMIGYETLITSYSEIEAGNFVIEIKATSFSIDDVVVSASRWNQPRRDVPAKIAMISRSKVALQNPQTAADLLGSSGEVFIQKSQLGGGSPMIRGFSTNRLLIAVDGIRMNNAIFRSGNLQNVIALDPLATEHTEVLFGPGSVMYGSDAIGGVMSFYTLDAELSLFDKPLIAGNGLIRYASAANERTGHFDINVGWRRWALRTSLTYTDYDDLRMGSNGREEYLRPWYVRRINGVDSILPNNDPEIQVPTGYNQVNFMQKIRFKPSEQWNLNYSFHYSTTSDNPRYDRLTQLKDDLPRSAEWYYGPQDWMMHNLTANHTASSGIYDDLTIRAAYQRFGESRVDRGYKQTLRRRRVERVDAYSLNLDLAKKLGNGQNLFYGVEAVSNDVTSTGEETDINNGETMPGPSRYPNSNWASFGAFANYQHGFSEKFLGQAGLRYSYFTLHSDFDTTFYPFPFTEADIQNGALTGSLGLIYHPDEPTTISLNLSTGFRSPNVDDVGKVFDSEPGRVVVPNPDLKAEYAYNAELGFARVFGEKFKLDFSLYYTLLDNAMVRRPYTIDGQDSVIYDGELSEVQAVQNAAQAKVYGVQIGVEFKLPAGFGLSSVFNYQKGEEELEDGSVSPSRHAAPAFGATHLTYTRNKLTLDLYATYSAERPFEDMPEEEKPKVHIYATDENGNPFSPSWYSINLKAIYHATDKLAFNLGVENITDQRYRPYSSGIVAPGLNIIGAVRLSF